MTGLPFTVGSGDETNNSTNWYWMLRQAFLVSFLVIVVSGCVLDDAGIDDELHKNPIYRNGYLFGQTAGKPVMVALNNASGASDYADLDFALYGRTNYIEVYENGTRVCGGTCGFSSYSTTDVFAIRRLGGEVTYWKNNTIFYTSYQTASGSQRVDTSFYNYGRSRTSNGLVHSEPGCEGRSVSNKCNTQT